jgi:hypothetical protein
MSEDKRIESFEEFWPYYVRAHSKKGTRTLHFVGTTMAMACVGGALVFRRPSLLLLAPIVGYGPAWIGHFFIEKNKPATFEHPLWSLRGDLLMWSKTIAGTMDAEVERCIAMTREAAPPAEGRRRETTNGAHAVS